MTGRLKRSGAYNLGVNSKQRGEKFCHRDPFLVTFFPLISENDVQYS
jgi:hypothetical protein